MYPHEFRFEELKRTAHTYYCKATLFNARIGEEAQRMLLSEWQACYVYLVTDLYRITYNVTKIQRQEFHRVLEFNKYRNNKKYEFLLELSQNLFL